MRERRRFFVQVLLVFLLATFCAPFTAFDEAQAYLADTESELVHYYLTPLPDSGEACAEAPAIKPSVLVRLVPFREPRLHVSEPAAAFFHPPK